MSNDDKLSTNIGFAVPQLFYDIIARLIPGAIIIGSFVLSAKGPIDAWESVRAWLRRSSEEYPSTIVILIGGFVLSYGISIVFLGLWSPLALIFSKTWSLIKKTATKLWSLVKKPKQRASLKKETSEDEYSMKYDFIKFKNAAAGNRIAKLHAEAHMAKVLILGFGISCVIDVWRYYSSSDRPLSRVLLGILLLIAAYGCYGTLQHLDQMRHRAVRNYAELLKYPQNAWHWRDDEKA
jgi:hypothetical protein